MMGRPLCGNYTDRYTFYLCHACLLLCFQASIRWIFIILNGRMYNPSNALLGNREVARIVSQFFFYRYLFLYIYYIVLQICGENYFICDDFTYKLWNKYIDGMDFKKMGTRNCGSCNIITYVHFFKIFFDDVKQYYAFFSKQFVSRLWIILCILPSIIIVIFIFNCLF